MSCLFSLVVFSSPPDFHLFTSPICPLANLSCFAEVERGELLQEARRSCGVANEEELFLLGFEILGSRFLARSW